MYIDIQTGDLLREDDIRQRAHPKGLKSPEFWDAVFLAEYGAAPFVQVEPPTVELPYVVQEAAPVEDEDGAWVQQWEIIAPTVAELAEFKKQEMAAARWTAQNSGITVGNLNIDSSNDTALYLREVSNKMAENPGMTLKWKTKNGNFVSVNKQQVDAVGDEIFTHVQGCFATEEDRIAEIDSIVADSELTDQEKLAALGAVTWDDPPSE